MSNKPAWVGRKGNKPLSTAQEAQNTHQGRVNVARQQMDEILTDKLNGCVDPTKLIQLPVVYAGGAKQAMVFMMFPEAAPTVRVGHEVLMNAAHALCLQIEHQCDAVMAGFEQVMAEVQQQWAYDAAEEWRFDKAYAQGETVEYMGVVYKRLPGASCISDNPRMAPKLWEIVGTIRRLTPEQEAMVAMAAAQSAPTEQEPANEEVSDVESVESANQPG